MAYLAGMLSCLEGWGSWGLVGLFIVFVVSFVLIFILISCIISILFCNPSSSNAGSVFCASSSGPFFLFHEFSRNP